MAQHQIACTHTGSLPRPDDLIQLMWAVGDGIPVDEAALEERIATAIDTIVGRQLDSGVTVVNDG
ncbi:MAG: epoxyalkane--coenzyme M transferase, partial [Actinobacteria bacterium]|nr:epoxyalkane--coenzyme M transferase [Actinomycetota bacterium]